MGTITFKMTAEEASAVQGFLRVQEQQKKIEQNAKNTTKTFSENNNETTKMGDNFTQIGEKGYAAFTKILGIVGLGGGLATAFQLLRSNLEEHLRLMSELGAKAGEIQAKSLEYAQQMPGNIIKTKDILEDIVKQVRSTSVGSTIQPAVTRKEIEEITAYTASSLGSTFSSQSEKEKEIIKEIAIKSATANMVLSTKDFADISAGITKIWGEDFLQNSSWKDIVTSAIQINPAKASSIAESLRQMGKAKEAGLTPTETLSLLIADLEKTGGTTTADKILTALLYQKDSSIQKQDKSKIKDPDIMLKYEQLEKMSEEERKNTLYKSEDFRLAYFGRQLSEEEFGKYIFGDMSITERRKKLLGDQSIATSILGKSGVNAQIVLAEYDRINKEITKGIASGSYAQQVNEMAKTDQYADKVREAQKDIGQEIMTKQMGAQEYEDVRSALEIFQQQNYDKTMKQQIDPTTWYWWKNIFNFSGKGYLKKAISSLSGPTVSDMNRTTQKEFAAYLISTGQFDIQEVLSEYQKTTYDNEMFLRDFRDIYQILKDKYNYEIDMKDVNNRTEKMIEMIQDNRKSIGKDIIKNIGKNLGLNFVSGSITGYAGYAISNLVNMSSLGGFINALRYPIIGLSSLIGSKSLVGAIGGAEGYNEDIYTQMYKYLRSTGLSEDNTVQQIEKVKAGSLKYQINNMAGTGRSMLKSMLRSPSFLIPAVAGMLFSQSNILGYLAGGTSGLNPEKYEEYRVKKDDIDKQERETNRSIQKQTMKISINQINAINKQTNIIKNQQDNGVY